MGVLGVLGDIALVAQLSGLHVAMLVAVAARLLRMPQCDAECARLEESTRRMRVLLRWPWPAAALDAAGVGGALGEADGLVGTYRRSTLWRRVQTARSVETRLRDARDAVDCLRALLLCVHASLLFAVRPASDDNATNHRVISDPLHGAETCDHSASSESQRYINSTVQEEAADDPSDNSEEEEEEFESAV